MIAVNTDGDLYNETESSQEIREYRYSGLNVNNYVTFNDEEWRIIGVFKNESGEEHLKIVRNEVLKRDIFPAIYSKNGIEYNIQNPDIEDRAAWNKKVNGVDENNDWTIAGLQYWLNDGSTFETKNPSLGYMSYLSKNAKDMIDETKYYLGAVSLYFQNENIFGVNDIPNEAYINERATNCPYGQGPSENNSRNAIEKNNECRVWANNQATWTGKVALLYPSDYGFSTASKYWNTKLGVGTFNGLPSDSSWLQKAKRIGFEFFLTPASATNLAIHWTFGGGLGDYYVNYFSGVRPTLYLKSNVKIISGDGTSDSPYVLTIN